MRRRVWSARSARHLFQIHAYIAHENPAAAGLVPGTRELLVSKLPYLVVYAVTDDAIEIHGVFHTALDHRSWGVHEERPEWS